MKRTSNGLRGINWLMASGSTVFVIAMLALGGRVTGLKGLHEWLGTSMAPNTAICLMLLGSALLINGLSQGSEQIDRMGLDLEAARKRLDESSKEEAT